MTCGADCELACNKDERILNVMALGDASGMSLSLSDIRTGTYHGPDKGLMQVVLVCLKDAAAR